MFLYFFPTITGITQAVIDAAGLQYALTRGEWQTRQVVIGPGQQSGLLVCRSTCSIDRAKFVSDKQQWRRIPKQNVYCGRWTDKPITPSDLERPTQCGAIPVQLSDGNFWNIAQARKLVIEDQRSYYFCPLPHDLDLSDDGDWIPSRVSEAYKTLSELMDEYWVAQSAALELSDGKPFVQFNFPKIDDLAVSAITANYYVSHVELALLSAYGINERSKIIEATLDTAFMKTMLQKKTDAAQDGSVLPHGLPATTEASKPAIPQPLAS
jgi:hypothetical protein